MKMYHMDIEKMVISLLSDIACGTCREEILAAKIERTLNTLKRSKKMLKVYRGMISKAVFALEQAEAKEEAEAKEVEKMFSFD